MARPRKTPPADAPRPPTVDPEEGISLIEGQIIAARALLDEPVTKNEYDSWILLTYNVLEMAFGSDSPNVSKVMHHARFTSVASGANEAWYAPRRATKLEAMISGLETLIAILRIAPRSSGTTQASVEPLSFSNRVFLVHGHNNEVLQETARFLESLKLDVVILREQPNQGRTVIEKFEAYSDVGFAVVLLTPDDFGGLNGTDASPRARQNVIFELGYFLAKLGRDRVCALHIPQLEIPSDYPVLYVPFDDKGGWRFGLAKEMKTAGLDIDMNLI